LLRRRQRRVQADEDWLDKLFNTPCQDSEASVQVIAECEEQEPQQALAQDVGEATEASNTSILLNSASTQQAKCCDVVGGATGAHMRSSIQETKGFRPTSKDWRDFAIYGLSHLADKRVLEIVKNDPAYDRRFHEAYCNIKTYENQ